MRLIHSSQIFLHLITGDPTFPYGASSRRSHGERIMLETPKDPIVTKISNISSKVDEYWPSTPTPLSHWRKIFNNSSAVHFFSSGTTKLFSYFFFAAHTSFSTASPQAQQSWRFLESRNIALTPSWDLTIVHFLILDLQISDQASKVVGPHYRFLIKPYHSS